jgi:HAD superfamily hydrolase (TIGR01509 family)
MIKAILFDIDGTLIDSNALHVDAWAEVFAQGGHDVPRADIGPQIGKGGDNLVPALLPDIDEEEQKRLADAHGAVFKARYIDRAQPFAGARALLERVHADGKQVVLASSASAEELDHYIALMDVGEIVAAKTSIDDVETSKPAPDIFAAALSKVGVAPDEAIAVGDTPYDVASADGAGVRTVAVLSGGFAEQALRKAGAVAVYADVAELLAAYGQSALAQSGQVPT